MRRVIRACDFLSNLKSPAYFRSHKSEFSEFSHENKKATNPFKIEYSLNRYLIPVEVQCIFFLNKTGFTCHISKSKTGLCIALIARNRARNTPLEQWSSVRLNGLIRKLLSVALFLIGFSSGY